MAPYVQAFGLKQNLTQTQLCLHEEILIVQWFIEYHHLINFPITPSVRTQTFLTPHF